MTFRTKTLRLSKITLAISLNALLPTSKTTQFPTLSAVPKLCLSPAQSDQEAPLVILSQASKAFRAEAASVFLDSQNCLSLDREITRMDLPKIDLHSASNKLNRKLRSVKKEIANCDGYPPDCCNSQSRRDNPARGSHREVKRRLNVDLAQQTSRGLIDLVGAAQLLELLEQVVGTEALFCRA
jgi:hypothetical protein